MDLVEKVYQASGRFPKAENFGLTNQIRRAAVSIPSNVAEGQGQGTTTAFLRFLAIARGSLQEVETQILVAGRLRYLEPPTITELMECTGEVAKLIGGLRASLANRVSNDEC
jgi:four helix bundle protein